MPTVSVRTLCRWLGINRSWYYQRRKSVDRERREVALRQAMEQIILSFPGYGYRRVTHALVRAGGPGQPETRAADHARTILAVSPQAAHGPYN